MLIPFAGAVSAQTADFEHDSQGFRVELQNAQFTQLDSLSSTSPWYGDQALALALVPLVAAEFPGTIAFGPYSTPFLVHANGGFCSTLSGSDVCQGYNTSSTTTTNFVTGELVAATTPFDAAEGSLRDTILGTAAQSLGDAVTNRRPVRDLRDRIVLGHGGRIGAPAHRRDATAGTVLASKTAPGEGRFDPGNARGRRPWTDLDLHRDGAGAARGLLATGLAWDGALSDATHIGYHLGIELDRDVIAGTFSGDQTAFGGRAGVHALHELGDTLFVDGFLTLAAARNDLELRDGTVTATGSYATVTTTFGLALTGIVQQRGYEIWPELALTAGHVDLGSVDYAGRTATVVDGDLHLDAGDVHIVDLSFTPEFRVPLDTAHVATSRSVLTLEPRVTCKRVETTVTARVCGGGAALGFVSRDAPGRRSARVDLRIDRIGDTTTTRLTAKLEF